jgi:phospholipase C
VPHQEAAMINEGVFGLEETLVPEIQGNQVVVNRHLRRVNGDAAIPPGQSVEFQFYVAQFPFQVLVFSGGAQIETSDISATPLVGGRAAPTLTGGLTATAPAAAAPAAAPPITAPPVTATPISAVPIDAGTLPIAHPPLDVALDPGLSVLSPADIVEVKPPVGSVARMRGINVSVFGNLFDIGVVEPPPVDPGNLPDPVVPFEVTLIAPNGLPPTVFTNPRASALRQIPPSDIGAGRIDPVFLDKGRGLWTIRVKNINPEARRITVDLWSKHALAPLRQQTIPLSLLNQLMSSVLKKALPTIAFSDGKLIVNTPTHFLGLMGADTEFSLGGVVASLLDSLPTFSPITFAVESRARLIDRITRRKAALAQEYGALIQKLLQQSGGTSSPSVMAMLSRRNKALEACDNSIKGLTRMAASQAVFCLVIEGMFSDAPISLDYVGDVAIIDNHLPQLGLVFDDRMQLSQVVSNLAVDLSPALAKVVLGTAALVALSAVALSGIFVPLGIGLAIFGGISIYNSINDYDVEAMIRAKILEKGPAISHYVKSAFERISAIGASVLQCELLPAGAADGMDALRVAYYDPSTAATPRPRRPTDVLVQAEFDSVAIAGGLAKARVATAVTVKKPSNRVRGTETRVKLASEPAGALPDDFVVRNPESLGLLDQHAAIVVLMMENRSFDHLFHDLAATYPNRGYTSVPAGFTNAAPPGFGAPFGVVKNTDIGIGNSLIFRRPDRSLDPDHNYEHTMFQIGGGTEETRGSGEMNGFARDFARNSNSPQVVMSHFGMDALPVYKVLANHYAVCDRWFAALPVGTYPNRLSALQGNVPFLHNIQPDDPSIGFLEDYNLFDLLNLQGISWNFFESDLGTIRLYDRFRLDVRNVRPIGDLDKTLRTGRDTGQLPRVMFIEPQFLFGNDDHPPMNVQDGQRFVRQVIGKFIDFGLLDRVLFLLTYDEHGGFFDHVPPPGTPRGPAEWLGQVASLFPQQPELAPKSMGVRVPSMVMSKFVSNSAKHQVLDHTSILKTILLHNRRQISSAQFSRFGERVKRGAHFGELMDLPVPRAVDYAAMAQAMGYHSADSWFSSVRPTIVESRIARLGSEHPARVLRGIAQPRAKRYTGG